MWATASWARRYWPELAWGAFAAANFAAIVLVVEYETVPFHYVWVSLTLLYGYRVWRMRTTLMTLALVCAASTVTLGYAIERGPHGFDELWEVPLMAAMFLAMVWHASRRQAALNELRRATAREHDFINDASHQFKTPVAVARGLAELIAQTPEDRKVDVADLIEELDRLGQIASSMLLLASAEQRDALVLSRVQLDDVMAGAMRRWRHTADRAWRLDRRTGGIVVADRQRLDTALDAVLENAVQATGEGDEIVLVVRADGDDAVIEVRDRGVGIPAHHLPRVFERFASVRYGSDTRPGIGLGLPITQAILAAHGGSVDVESTLGHGTTVTLRLPGLTATATQGSDGPLALAAAD